jgi:hypothetical protein
MKQPPNRFRAGWMTAVLASFIAASLAGACANHSGAAPTPGTAARSGLVKARPHAAPTETPPPPSAYMDDTWNGIHVFQPFDNFDNKNIIPASQAAADGPLYNVVWGSDSGTMVAAWKTNNPTIRTSYYIPIGTDALTDQFGNKGHKKPWWQNHHPDWILYQCDQTTIAYVQGIPETPLDISNPDVIAYLESLVGTYAEGHGYAAIGADFAELNNPTGGNNGGSRGCGVWTQNHTVWVQKFSGNPVDPAYASAVLNWLSSFRAYTHGLPRPMALWGNNVPGFVPPGDPGETQIVADLDIVEDESGDARYGKFADDKFLNNTVTWAQYIQSQGKGYMPTGLWHVPALSSSQIEYAIAGYLMSKEQASAMTADPYGTYGIEHYYPAYTAPIGTPCAEMYGGPHYNGQYVYYRAFSGGLAVLSTSATTTYTVTLPQASYTDAVTGATVTSPLSVGPDNGFVLLNASGCP